MSLVGEPEGKSMTRLSRWQPEWAAGKGSSFVHCNICLVNFSVVGGGFHEVNRHMDTNKYKENARGVLNQASTTSIIMQRRSVEDQVTIAELLCTTFNVEHNLPFIVSDYFLKLCKAMFPHSKIAEGLACGKTKATAIVKCALAAQLNIEVIEACQSSPFTIICNGSNDQFVRK